VSYPCPVCGRHNCTCLSPSVPLETLPSDGFQRGYRAGLLRAAEECDRLGAAPRSGEIAWCCAAAIRALAEEEEVPE